MSTKPSNCIAYSQALKAERDNPDGCKVTWSAIASAHRVSDSTAGRILDGDRDDVVREINGVLCSPLAELMASALTCGTPFRFVRVDASRDIDGDGHIDNDDVLLGMASAVKRAGEAMTAHVARRRQDHYFAGDAERAVRQIDETIRELETARANVLKLTPGVRIA